MTVQVEQLITEHLDLWTQAQTAKSTSGRGSNNKIELNGIKKLRELILELAVRGKLVPQDPNDEPASELLKRIAAEKEALVKAKILRKSKELAPVATKEIPYDIPNGWILTRLGSIGDWGAGATPSRARSEYYGGDIPWFKSGELTSDFIDFSEEKITSLALQDCSLRLNKIGDVLVAMYGATIGKASILSVEGTTNQAVCACTPFSGITNFYLLTLLKAYKNRFVSMGAGGAQPNISREKIIATPILLPPLNEQTRIVAKVDELMALCDQLEQQSYQQLDAHNQLVDALLATLTQSQNADELASNWHRLAAHFDALFTTEYSINALKQTILQLAVMGKLCKQDPNDEPASELLKRIAAEKDALIKAGKIKKQKPLPPISDDEKPFELPVGWEWVKLGDIYPEFQNGASSRGDSNGRDIVVLRLADISNLKISEADTRTLQIAESSLDKYNLGCGDILIVRVNGSADLVGRFIHCDKDYDAIYCDHFIRMRFSVFAFVTEFLVKISNSLLVREAIHSLFVSTAGQKTVNQTHISSLLVPVPPLKEQIRILNKLKELEHLTECLCSHLSSVKHTQAVLAEALVEQVVA